MRVHPRIVMDFVPIYYESISPLAVSRQLAYRRNDLDLKNEFNTIEWMMHPYKKGESDTTFTKYSNIYVYKIASVKGDIL